MFLQDKKKQKNYKKALNAVVDLCSQNGIDNNEKLSMPGSSIMLDFELAMIKTIQSLFKKASVKSCKFHLGQSWWRKIKELGLSATYRNMKCAYGRWKMDKRSFRVVCTSCIRSYQCLSSLLEF